MVYTREEVHEATLDYFNNDELATNVFFKYALRNFAGEFLESTPNDMHQRLASEFHRAERKFPNPATLSSIQKALNRFKYICPQGSPSFGIGNPKPVSLSNCFVIPSPEDDMSSIIESAKHIANLSKRRGGVGVDISNLRPDGTLVNNAAESSSGAWSFADLYSFVGRMVGQGGRRAALMISIDCRHPDIKKFITMKLDKTKVTGANISIKIRDDFMEAALADEEYQLQWPVDSDNPSIVETVRAKEIWNLITETATISAEPGVLMWDNITKYLPADYYKQFKTISTNPCGELPLSAGDSCRLISINLKWYVNNPYTPEAYFDYDLFVEHIKLATRLSDDLVELELEKLRQISEKINDASELELFALLIKSAEDGRRTGLGTHGMGDALMRLRLAYDSDEAIPVIDKIAETVKLTAYRESVELAKQRGAFPAFDWETEKACLFYNTFPQDLIDDISTYGRRNISLLTDAPTGSTSIESQIDCFGIEPAFRLIYVRRRKLDHNEAHIAADFVDEMGDRWIEFEVVAKSVQEWIDATGLTVADLPDYFVTSEQIEWKNRVRVQATLSKHIDHSISSTINLPRGTDSVIVGQIYEEAWRQGCKGVTVYVEGSRDGVLLSGDELTFEYHDAPARQEELGCDIHQVKVKGVDYTILVGMFEGKPYEVMGGKSSRIEIPEEYTQGRLIKRRNKTVPNRYDLRVNGFKIKDVVSTFDNADIAVVTRMVSTSLRHGVRPSFLVEQLSKDPDASFASFAKVLARVLKKYIEDGTMVRSSKEGNCPDGEPHELIYQEGCVICAKCGWSKCG